MSQQERLLEAVQKLSPAEQERVLQFIEEMHQGLANRHEVGGRFEGEWGSLSFEEIKEASREAWANFPRDFPAEDPQ